MIPVSLAEVPLLHWFTQYRGHEFCSNDEQGSMLRPRELLKHTYVREPVVWSGTRKGQVRISSSVPAPGSETGCTLWIIEQDLVIICCPLNQTLSVGCIGSVFTLYMLAIKITSIYTWGWEHQKGHC